MVTNYLDESLYNMFWWAAEMEDRWLMTEQVSDGYM